MKIIEQEEIKKPGTGNPYMSKGIYKNYESAMKEKNVKRRKDRLQTIHIKSYEEWSGQ